LCKNFNKITMNNKSNFFKLAVMMFMQYMLLAVWWMQFAAYLGNIGIANIALIVMSMAIGSMAAPLVGMLADRYIASEKLLAGLNLLVAVFLFLATQQTGFAGVMITITLAMLCYMPSWSLTSSIAMTHLSSEQFPRVRLMGSIGWFAASGFSLAAINLFDVKAFDGTILPLYCGVGVTILTALLNLFLPKTPPSMHKSSTFSVSDIFGFRIISELKNKHFNRFILITLLTLIPFTLFYTYGSIFLADQNYTYITFTLNWGLIPEVIFLFITTLIIVKYGFKNVLLFGLSAMLFRYISLYIGVELGQPSLYIVGILMHGLIFGLFFVSGQVYTNKVVPDKYRAQAQGLLAFLTWGVGIFAGNMISGWLKDNILVNGQTNWSLLFAISAIATLAIIVLHLLLFKNPPAEDNNQ